MTPSSARVLYLSEHGIVADGQTDQAAPLQSLFDRAQDGPLEIVHDLSGDLLTSGNDVWSQTTVRTLAGGVWRLQGGSARGILRNRHPLGSWPQGAIRQDGTVSEGPTAPVDRHIHILGGTFDGNRRGGGWPNNGRTPLSDTPVYGVHDMLVSALQFYGVRGLRLDGVTVYDSPTLAIHLGNVFDVSATDCVIDFPAVIYGCNQDGFHLNGPADNVSLTNLTCRQTSDDALMLGADDSMETTTEGRQAYFFGMNVGWGDITRVRVRGVHLDRCSSGIRFLSATQRIDEVVISEVQGTCLIWPILIDKYLFPDAGNIGRLTFENVSVQTLGANYDGQAPGFWPQPVTPPGEALFCNTRIEELTLRNVSHRAPSPTHWGRFLSPCVVEMLNVDGCTCCGAEAETGKRTLLQVEGGATLRQCALRGVNWLAKHGQAGSVFHNAGTIETLVVSNLAVPAGTEICAENAPARTGGHAFTDDL